MKLAFLLLFSFIAINTYAQDYTISGYVTDQESGEPLISATIFEVNHQKGTTTNEYGFFSLTVPKGAVIMKISYVGFQTIEKKIDLLANEKMNIALSIGDITEVVVTAGEAADHVSKRMQISSVNLPIQQIKALPMLAGEADILKALTLTPGVSSGQEGSTGLLVRGGTPDQNLILLDGATVYNASHLFGFLSVFNTDAINNVELIKGGFPAHYGGRLSSILDITMKEGNKKEASGSFSVGILTSKIQWESPLGERASYLLSARASYLGLLTLPAKISFENGNRSDYINYNLYDINAKINYRFEDDSQLFFSTYTGNDFFNSEEGDGAAFNKLSLNWGNLTNSLRYQKAFSPKLFGNAMLNYTRYNYDLGSESRREIPSADIKQKTSLHTVSNIQDIAAKYRIDYLPNPNHYIKIGGETIRHRFAPNIYQLELNDSTNTNETKKSAIAFNTEMAVYVEDEIKITDNFGLNVGLRYSALKTDNEWYGGLEPRLALHYQFHNDWSIKGGYSIMRQYIHLLSNNGIGIPNDIWVPVTDRIRPQKSTQYALGITKYIKKWNIEASVEGYYKLSDDLIDYKNGANFLFDFTTDWQDIVETGGQGKAYGTELFLHKKAGRFNGWLGYTLAWNNRKFENINGGNWYSAKYDRRHDFEITVNYKMSDSWDISGVWVYSTGAAITLPTAQYDTPNSGNIAIYNKRNDHRMPSYHRLDIGLNYHPNDRSTLNFSAYNAYNRKNPFYLQIENIYEYENGIENEPTNGYSQLIQKSLFPIIPSISYTLKFK